MYRALKELRHRIWGVHFRLDHDAKSLAKMLQEPNDVPNAPLLRWVAWCQLFNFEPNHVSATQFKVEDALSRRPPAPEDGKFMEPDTDDFAESYLNVIYGVSNNSVPEGASPQTAVKFLFDSLYFDLSNQYDVSWRRRLQIPFFWISSAVHTLELEPGGWKSEPVRPEDPFSLFRASELRYVDTSDSRPLPEFYTRKVFLTRTEQLLLGDELMPMEYVEWESYTQSIPLNELLTRSGHRHGLRDRDGPEYWSEIREFLSSGKYPSSCTTDCDRL